MSGTNDPIDLFSDEDSAVALAAIDAQKRAVAAAAQTDGDAQAVEAARAQVEELAPPVIEAMPLLVQVPGLATQVANNTQTTVTKAGEAAGSASAASGSASAAAGSALAAGLSVPVTADRVTGARLNNTSAWNIIRPTPVYAYNAQGVLTEVPPHTLAYDFDKTTKAPRSVLFAGQVTNLIRDPRAEGGTPGVIGSGGVLPPGLNLPQALPSGLQLQYVGSSTLATGEPVYYLRWFGTPATAEYTRIQALIAPGVNYAVGDILYARIGYFLAAGTLTGFVGYSARLNGPAGTPSSVTTPAPTASVQYVNHAMTITAANTTANGWGIQPLFQFSSGAAIDVTFGFVMPIVVKKRFLCTTPLPTPGVPRPTTEAQTLVDIPLERLGANWNYRQGTIIASWSSRTGAFTSSDDNDWFGLFSWGDGTADERFGPVVNPAHTLVQARLTVGGVAQTVASCAMTAPAAGVPIICALAWDLDAGKFQVAARGAYGTQVTLSALPKADRIMLGRFGPTHPGFINLPGPEVRPAALFNAALGGLT